MSVLLLSPRIFPLDNVSDDVQVMSIQKDVKYISLVKLNSIEYFGVYGSTGVFNVLPINMTCHKAFINF